jgi:Helix-turn-helix domain
MDEREQQRTARHRLAVLRHAEQVTGDVAATCRYYGISRRCFYQWKRRYDELGEAGLRDCASGGRGSSEKVRSGCWIGHLDLSGHRSGPRRSVGLAGIEPATSPLSGLVAVAADDLVRTHA